MKNNTAIILLGGGMNSVYGSGFLSELFKRNLFPDIVIASSGNAGNAAYYVSKDIKALEYATECWYKYLSTKEFIDLKRKNKKIDIDFLVDKVFKEYAPMDILAISKSEIMFYIPTTNIETTRVEFFSNKSLVNFFDLLRATKAVPYYYGKFINLINNFYADFSPLIDFKEYLKICKEQNTENIILVNNQDESFFGNLLFIFYATIFINFRFIFLLKGLFSNINNKEQALRGAGLNYIYFKNNQVGTFENELVKLQNSFEQGSIDAISNIEKISSILLQ